MEIRKILKRRLKIILIVIALIFSFLVIRITQLMFFNRELVPPSPDPPEYSERGFILDRNNEKLAISLETYSIYVRPKEVENKKKAAREIASAIDEDYSSILRSMNRKKPFVWIQRQIDIRYTERVENLDTKGVYLEKEYRRHYPHNNLASHILGFSGIDNVGLEGIEYQLDDVLLPRRIDNKGIDTSGIRRGYTVVLTIDRYIQEVVEEELERALESSQAKLITGIVMNPNTGEILALANKPDYDLNDFQRYSDERKRNRAITDPFEPGSTFKVFIASILLEKELVSENDQFNCTGSIDVEGAVIDDIRKHGNINFREVLEQSCNVGMVESVKRIDKNAMYERLRAFGFGVPTGINLPGEGRGILRNPKNWSGISKYAIAIGQEISATPLQIAQAASAIANSGMLMQPRIIKRIESPDGSILKDYSPLKIRTVVSEPTSELVLDLLTGVISERGTGYKAKVEGYTIAGKTGTAQIADIELGGYLEDQFYASFLGFVPVPNPRIVVLVTLDRPVGEVYGGQTAAPVFRNIVERISHYLNILPSFSEIYILRDG
ncbi:MAG: penicillin-binding protein 2 [Spirochaetota bacterium]|nr:MAG: penicillin-binding protein 2 [Spirochaetota bacterium]